MPNGPFFVDSFDDRATAHAGSKWSSYSNSGTPDSIAAGGRTGKWWRSQTGASAFGPASLQKNFSARPTLYVGCACASVYNNALGSETNWRLLSIMDGSTEQIAVVLADTVNYYLRVVNGDGTVLATSNQALGATIAYLELKATIHNTAGAFELKMNGVTLCSGSGVNTRQSANNQATGIKIGVNTVRIGYGYDDLYIADDQFYGGLKIYALLPNAAGDLTQFSPSTSSNWTCVDEADPNDNADYVYQSGTTSEDLYQYQNLTDSSQPYGVQLWTRHERDDTVVRKFTPQCKSVSTDSSFAEVTTSNGTYADDVQWMGIDPATGVPWTVAGINSAQFGIKITV